MKFCPECGNPLRENAKFCEACGLFLASVELPNAARPPSYPPQYAPSMPNPQEGFVQAQQREGEIPPYQVDYGAYHGKHERKDSSASAQSFRQHSRLPRQEEKKPDRLPVSPKIERQNVPSNVKLKHFALLIPLFLLIFTSVFQFSSKIDDNATNNYTGTETVANGQNEVSPVPPSVAEPEPEVEPEAVPSYDALSYMLDEKWFASSDDKHSTYVNTSEDQGVQIEMRKVAGDYYAIVTLYPLWLDSPSGDSVGVQNGDSLLPVEWIDENTYSIPFQAFGENDLILTVNPIGKVFFTQKENARTIVENMELQPASVWKEGSFSGYDYENSYESMAGIDHYISPLEAHFDYTPMLHQIWVGGTNDLNYRTATLYYVTCYVRLYRNDTVDFTYYEVPNPHTLHTARVSLQGDTLWKDDITYRVF